MKHFLLFILSLFTFTTNSFSQTTNSILIEDIAQPSLHMTVKHPTDKRLRLKSTYGGNIKTYYVGNFTESMKTAIEQAVDLWKGQLRINGSKTIPLVFEAIPMDGDIATQIDISYQNIEGVSYSELACINKCHLIPNATIADYRWELKLRDKSSKLCH